MRQPRDPALTQFGAQVRGYRKMRQISQEELADLCGLDRTYISGIECGTRNPTLLVIERISLALGIRSHELLFPLPINDKEDQAHDQQQTKS